MIEFELYVFILIRCCSKTLFYVYVFDSLFLNIFVYSITFSRLSMENETTALFTICVFSIQSIHAFVQ